MPPRVGVCFPTLLVFLSLVVSVDCSDHARRQQRSATSTHTSSLSISHSGRHSDGTSPPPLAPINLIVVRHGLSCANAAGLYGSELSARDGSADETLDPVLTHLGIAMSANEARVGLARLIAATFGSHDYSILSSALLRAQETAWYSLGKPSGKSVNIVPFVAEVPPDAGPRHRNAQREILAQRNAAVLKSSGLDFRIPCSATDASPCDNVNDGTSHGSSFSSFLSWLAEEPSRGSRWLVSGSDGILRGVLFTHGQFMAESFGVGADDFVSNNFAIGATLLPPSASDDSDSMTMHKATGEEGVLSPADTLITSAKTPSGYKLDTSKGAPVVHRLGLPMFQTDGPVKVSAFCKHGSGCTLLNCPSELVADEWDDAYVACKFGGQCSKGIGGAAKDRTKST